MTLSETFAKFLRSTYPDGGPAVGSEQRRQLEMAFYGGVVTTLGASLDELDEMTGEIALWIHDFKVRHGLMPEGKIH